MSDKHHAGHTHAANQKRLGLTVLITGAFLVVEVIGGLVSGSLALLADAGHMLIDLASLIAAWYAFRLGAAPADSKRSYGFGRFQVLVAYTNGLALFAIAAWIVYEAIERLSSPHTIAGGLMLGVAIAGILANIVAFLLLHGGDHHNLNVRAAALHVLGDLLGSAAATVAALVILGTGWTPIDPIASVVVAVIILRSAWRVVSEAGHILIEGTPEDIDTRAMASDLVASIPGVEDVHHVHVWSITQERPIATLHARIGEDRDPADMLARIKARLREKFDLDHATIELERGSECADLRKAEPA